MRENDHQYLRSDKAHGEALACSLILTQILRLMRDGDPDFVSRVFSISRPKFRPFSPVEEVAYGRINELTNLVQGQSGAI